MNILKKIYTTPKTDIETISNEQGLLSALTQSGPVCTPENTCPFNKLWCCEKQKRFNQYNNVFSKAILRYKFAMHSGIFNGCPYDYESLCYNHKERQRG